MDGSFEGKIKNAVRMAKYYRVSSELSSLEELQEIFKKKKMPSQLINELGRVIANFQQVEKFYRIFNKFFRVSDESRTAGILKSRNQEKSSKKSLVSRGEP